MVLPMLKAVRFRMIGGRHDRRRASLNRNEKVVDILGLPKHASLPQKSGAPSILRVGCVAESCLCVERALEL
jgi:hypothetical protein